jgi:hypothetical protein
MDPVRCCVLDGSVSPAGKEACEALGGLSMGVMLCSTDPVCCHDATTGTMTQTDVGTCSQSNGEVNPLNPSSCS